ncbi:MAG: NADH-ubiquinone oxidoreductase-F iron-sulfur binding region domain-containing protein [Firmicutes bacterium]|nr:NADH-ubiquinone oxidoreductase-F iron-sulfur binding region domain-containing protein [Bacillota bacterium]
MFEIEKNKDIVDNLVQYMNDNREAKGVLMATLFKSQELIGYIPRDIVILIEEVLGAPISRIDNLIQYYSFLNDQPVEYTERQKPYVSQIKKKYTLKDIIAIDKKEIPSLSVFKDIDSYIDNGGFGALANVLSHAKANTLQTIKDSGFKGKGDGGFVASIKWEAIANIIEFNNKGIICNADINNNAIDGKIINDNPFKLIEGMIIAGYSVGTNQGYIYTSYTKEMEKAVKDAYAAGILGEKVLNNEFSFNIEVRFSADNFVSPREVEVDEYIERDINVHRDKNVNVRSFGVSGKPLEYYITEKCIGCTKCAKNCPVSCIESAPKTRHIIDPTICIQCGNCMSVCPVAAIVYTNLVANVETLINVPDVLNLGVDAYKEIGTPKNPGFKIISLEGDVNTPSIIEVPTNTTIKEIIDTYSGGVIGELVGVRIGGPIGPILTLDKLEKAVDLDTPLKFGLISGVMEGTSIYVVAGKTSMMDLAKESMEYAIKESCGKCVPCREGTKRAAELLETISKDGSNESNLEKLTSLTQLMESASLCALGQLAPSTITSILTNYKDLL